MYVNIQLGHYGGHLEEYQAKSHTKLRKTIGAKFFWVREGELM